MGVIRLPSLHRDIYHMTRPWARRRTYEAGEVVWATRRLMTHGPTPDTVQQWMADLRTVVAGVEERVASGRYAQTERLLYAQRAAARVRTLLDAVSPEDVVSLHQGEEGHWVRVS